MTSPGRRTTTTRSGRHSSKKDPDDDDAKPYIIVTDIGKGSFATVYKGYHAVCVSCRYQRIARSEYRGVGHECYSRHQGCKKGHPYGETAR